ncbi:MAG TPA: hypothetical protein VF043_23175 [Ktedonobacteraceae bacterium]
MLVRLFGTTPVRLVVPLICYPGYAGSSGCAVDLLPWLICYPGWSYPWFIWLELPWLRRFLVDLLPRLELPLVASLWSYSGFQIDGGC